MKIFFCYICLVTNLAWFSSNGIDVTIVDSVARDFFRTEKPLGKTFTKNWVSKQSFFVSILTKVKKHSFRDKTFFFKIKSWNCQQLFENTKFQLNQTTNRKTENNNCLNELKSREVSRNSISNKCYLSWKTKKVLFLKNILFYS